MSDIVGVDIEREERLGEGGFLFIRRCRLRSRRADGTQSASYPCDFVVRPMGLDAVAVAVYTRARGPVEVLVRGGVRPPLVLGRGDAPAPVPDARPYVLFGEVVAGIIEAQDR